MSADLQSKAGIMSRMGTNEEGVYMDSTNCKRSSRIKPSGSLSLDYGKEKGEPGWQRVARELGNSSMSHVLLIWKIVYRM